MTETTALNSTMNLKSNSTGRDPWIQVAELIGISYPAVYCLIGVPLNIINVAFVSNRWRKSSHSVYVIILSIVDSLFLTHRAASVYLPNSSIPLTTGACAWMQFVIQTSSQISSWTLVLLCCERAMVVKFPFSRLTLFTCRRAILSAVSATAIIVLLNSFVLFAMKVYVTQERVFYCAYRAEYLHIMRTVLYKVEAFVYVFIPFILLLISNLVIVDSLYKSRGFRGKMKSNRLGETRRKSTSLSLSNSCYSTDKRISMSSVERWRRDKHFPATHRYDTSQSDTHQPSTQQYTTRQPSTQQYTTHRPLTHTTSAHRAVTHTFSTSSTKSFRSQDINMTERSRANLEENDGCSSKRYPLCQNAKSPMQFLLVLHNKRKMKNNPRSKTSFYCSTSQEQEVDLPHTTNHFKSKYKAELPCSEIGRDNFPTTPLLAQYQALSKTKMRDASPKSLMHNCITTSVPRGRDRPENIQLKELYTNLAHNNYHRRTNLVKSSSLVNFQNPHHHHHHHQHFNETKPQSKSVTSLINVTNSTDKSPCYSPSFQMTSDLNHRMPPSPPSPPSPSCLPTSLAEELASAYKIKTPFLDHKTAREISSVNTSTSSAVNKGSNDSYSSPYFNQILTSALVASMVFFLTTAPFCVISIFINFIYTPGTHNNTPFMGFLMTFSVALCDLNHVTNFFIYSMKSSRVAFSSLKTLLMKLSKGLFKRESGACQRQTSFMLTPKKSISGSTGSSGARQSHGSVVRAHL